MQDLSNKTLSQIVTDHYQTASIFEKYGLDFCCKGKRLLASACEEKNVPYEEVLKELYQVLPDHNKASDFSRMSLTELAEYIVRVHHSYVKQNMPQIFNYTLKVATKHGEHFPYMKEVHLLFSQLKTEMEQHMMKEEKILFPRIKLLELNISENTNPGYLKAPIDMMEEEHDKAGTIMQKIRDLTNNYTAPEQACTTFCLTLDSLKAFEQDLHKHVHLENNILFPKAIQLFTQPASSSIAS
ncbi:MAG: iron-sulfur cluster repair di-iron protein [Flavisolibacter sp.]